MDWPIIFQIQPEGQQRPSCMIKYCYDVCLASPYIFAMNILKVQSALMNDEKPQIIGCKNLPNPHSPRARISTVMSLFHVHRTVFWGAFLLRLCSRFWMLTNIYGFWISFVYFHILFPQVYKEAFHIYLLYNFFFIALYHSLMMPR